VARVLPCRSLARLAWIAEEQLPDDLVGELLSHLDVLQGDVDVRRLTGREIGQLRDRSAQHHGRRLEHLV